MFPLFVIGFWIGMATGLVVGSLTIFIYLMFIGNWNLMTQQVCEVYEIDDSEYITCICSKLIQCVMYLFLNNTYGLLNYSV